MNKGRHSMSLYKGKKLSNNGRIKRDWRLPVVIVDETGGINMLASNKAERRTHFTVVGTLVTDRKRFKATMNEFPRKDEELKYSGTTRKERKRIFEDLAAQDFLFSEVHKSRRNECFKDNKARVRTYVDMVSKVLDMNYSGCPCDVLIDSPPVAALEELEELCSNSINQGIEIHYFEVCPSSNEWALQIHDFITGAVGDDIEGITDRGNFYNTIKDKHRR